MYLLQWTKLLLFSQQMYFDLFFKLFLFDLRVQEYDLILLSPQRSLKARRQPLKVYK